MKIKHTIEQIDEAIRRASELSLAEISYLGRKLDVLKDLRNKMEQKERSLSAAQINYLNNLMKAFSEDTLSRAEKWETEWKTNKSLRERVDVVSKYYIAQKSWFMSIAQSVQRILQSKDETEIPEWHLVDRMINNEYAEKVWESHSGEHIWQAGDLVCCRTSAKIDGFVYMMRALDIDINKDPCLVLESGSMPISSAVKYDKKRGGCRWVAINPVGTGDILHVMEKDLKKYRQPKTKKGSKK